MRALLAEHVTFGPDLRLVFDLDQLSLIDSAGLGVVARAHQVARAAGGAVLVVAGDGPVRRTFVLTGMDRVLPIHSTRQSAIQAVGHPGPGCG